MLIPDSWGSLRRLVEFNPCHVPGGKPTGGQFGRKDQCGADGQTAPPAERDRRDGLLGRWLTDEALTPDVREAMLKAADASFNHPFVKRYGARETMWPLGDTRQYFNAEQALAAINRPHDALDPTVTYARMVEVGMDMREDTYAPEGTGTQFIEDTVRAGGIPGMSDSVAVNFLASPEQWEGLVRTGGANSVHTHPSDSPFSEGDLGVFMQTHRNMYVVTRDGDWYHLGWQNIPRRADDHVTDAVRSFLVHRRRYTERDTLKAIDSLEGFLGHSVAARDIKGILAKLDRSSPVRLKIDKQWKETQLDAWAAFDFDSFGMTFRRGRFRQWPGRSS
jgi:hypothetical protein